MRVIVRCVLVLIAVFAGLTPSTSHADALVTACQVDNQTGAGTNLRDAIAGGGKITFSCPGASVIRITQALDLDSVSEIDGQNKITFDGTGSTSIFVSKGGLHGRALVLRNLAIRRGKPDSAAIVPPGQSAAVTVVFNSNDSSLTLDHVTITETERPVYVAFGTLTVTNSEFDSNIGPVIDAGTNVAAMTLVVSNTGFHQNQGSALVTFGATVTLTGLDVQGRSDSTERGSVFNGGSLTIRNSRFQNVWGNSQCGGALQSSANTTIANTSFTGNRSACGGGAVYIWGATPQALLRAVTFENNQSGGRGGAVSLDDLDAVITLQFAEFRNNSADFGGALALNGGSGGVHPQLNASAVSFKNNASTQSGAAIYVNAGGLQITRGIFIENKPANGGVLTAASGVTPFVLGDILLARNTGAVGLENVAGTLVNATIAENDGIGIQPSGTLRVTNSVIAGNRKQNCLVAAGSSLVDGGANIQFPGNTCGASVPTADPILDSFYVPDPASPLQAAGQDPACKATPVFNRDVYGQPRPRSVHCTIGAVEGDIDQLLHRVGIVGSRQPPNGQPGSPPGPGTGPGSPGEPPPSSVPGSPPWMRWCLWLASLLVAALVVTLILLWRCRRKHHHHH